MANATPRILVVDDHFLLADAIAAMVVDLSYEVIGPLHNLNDALDHAKREDVQFALLDFDLGNGTDATPIAETLIARGVPFAFTTGSDAGVILAAFEQATIVPKPVAFADLAHVLATSLSEQAIPKGVYPVLHVE